MKHPVFTPFLALAKQSCSNYVYNLGPSQRSIPVYTRNPARTVAKRYFGAVCTIKMYSNSYARWAFEQKVVHPRHLEYPRAHHACTYPSGSPVKYITVHKYPDRFPASTSLQMLNTKLLLTSLDQSSWWTTIRLLTSLKPANIDIRARLGTCRSWSVFSRYSL